ncbi:MAG: nucleotidyltransferase domain-containing protein [Candidatus Aenigmarchaeota archaeon]|nr:nucleotidyltransferase domain-containing protein [Candidatus Aenigmarchaeota archaeon]
MRKDMSDILEKAKKDKDVLAVGIFGSLARKERHRDIDVCIFLKAKQGNLQMSKKKLDYLKGAKNRFDIKIFQQLPIYIRHRILKEGKIIFCANEDALYDLAHLTVKEFEDFKPIYRSYLEAVKHG